MMPGRDGYHLCRQVREDDELPVVLLTAKDQERDKVLGLGMGADDYVTKPFSPLELVARIKAHMRRYQRLRGVPKGGERLRMRSLKIDTGKCRVFREGREVKLPAKEYEILEYLALHEGQVLTRAQIFEAVWNELALEADNTVMVHVRHLREKLEDDPSNPRLIRTIRGLGYRLEVNDDG